MLGRRPTGAIFAVRQLMAQHRVDRNDCIIAFIDHIENAHDRVPRQDDWICMMEKGVSDMHVRIVQDMYEGATIREKAVQG